tara:strand:- start:251 stop:835 length:585 start_codon:yes stop_codon:yes gene_type:complete
VYFKNYDRRMTEESPLIFPPTFVFGQPVPVPTARVLKPKKKKKTASKRRWEEKIRAIQAVYDKMMAILGKTASSLREFKTQQQILEDTNCSAGADGIRVYTGDVQKMRHDAAKAKLLSRQELSKLSMEFLEQQRALKDLWVNLLAMSSLEQQRALKDLFIKHTTPQSENWEDVVANDVFWSQKCAERVFKFFAS